MANGKKSNDVLRGLGEAITRDVRRAVSGPATRIREERERQQRREQVAKQTVAELKSIRRILEGERLEKERLADQVKEIEEKGAAYRTGAPGRPGSKHLILAEFERRMADGSLEPTVREQGEDLAEWLLREHPAAAPIKPKTAENAIRALYRSARRAQQQGPQKE
ncbi:MAG: hypothetical protein GY722_07605 [bacterium]|nr:hypothetical protein [bacterium]